MPVLPQIVFTGLNFTHSATVPAAISKFVHDRSLPLILWTWISANAAAAMNSVSSHAAAALTWLAEPHVLAVILAWSITFIVVFLVFSLAGFNPVGIGAGEPPSTHLNFTSFTNNAVPGTLAAAFQSFMYGGFTPAGGLFATLTSLGMLGVLAPLQAMGAAVLATTVAGVVWLFGVGR